MVSSSRIRFSLLCVVLAMVSGCDLKPGDPQRSATNSASASSAEDSAGPALAVQSVYYSETVGAELAAAGLSPLDFKKGQRLFELYCLNCHTPPDGKGPENRLAPPAFAVADHYRRGIPETAARIAAIRDYTEKPAPEKSLMPGAIRRFGAMSPMPLAETQLQQVATFLATARFKPPPWYDAHYAEEHGPDTATQE